MKKFLLFTVIIIHAVTLSSCSKDEIQSGVNITFNTDYYAGKTMAIYPIIAENTKGNKPIVERTIGKISPIKIDLNEGNYYIEFGEPYYNTGFIIIKDRRTKIHFKDGGYSEVYYN